MYIKVILILVFLAGSSTFAFSQCGPLGPRNSGSVVNDASTGVFSWNNTGNAILSDNVRSSAGSLIGILSSANSNYLVFKSFGFALPAAAEVCGIEVSIERSGSGIIVGSSIRDKDVRIIRNNVISGTNHASALNWTGSDVTAWYGNNSDKWGVALTPDDINSTDFGVAVSARLSAGLASVFLSANIDQVQVTVYYSLVLPVMMQRFSARPVGNKVTLNWKAVAEISDYYLVERNNVVIDSVQPHPQVYYEVIDDDPQPVNHYRLIEVNKGNKHFSKIVTIRMDDEPQILVYPNPATERIFIKYSGRIQDVQMQDMCGRTIAIYAGKEILLPRRLKGVYLLRIKVNDAYVRKTILINGTR